MKLPPTAVIADEKVRDYRLRPRREDDKSAFFARAGYRRQEWLRLADDLRQQILPLDGQVSRSSVYGDYYSVIGPLTGPNGTILYVETIWLVERDSQAVRFITAYPAGGLREIPR